MAESTTMSTTTSRKRPRENDVSGPPKKLRKAITDVSIDSQDTASDREDESPRPASKHSKKERKQNRSSRIHSLRKLLARGTLPRTIQQEKERELSALLQDQDKHKSKKQAKKVLEKYHYVRFVERQKAEKRLKQLRKQLQAADSDQAESLKVQIHEMEVNRNYAIHAPLCEKYVSIFAPRSRTPVGGGTEPYTVSSKPVMWYTVEATMLEGQFALEALRDRNEGTAGKVMEEDNGSWNRSKSTDKVVSRIKFGQGLQTAKFKGSQQGGQRHTVKTTPAADVEEEDHNMSDGGFFER